MVEALLLGDRIAVLHDGPARAGGNARGAAARTGRRRASRSCCARRGARPRRSTRCSAGPRAREGAARAAARLPLGPPRAVARRAVRRPRCSRSRSVSRSIAAPRSSPRVLGAASAIQTIPGLALLAVMVPLFAGLGALLAGTGLAIRGIGALPALVALALYGLLPILRNTVTGLARRGLRRARGRARRRDDAARGALARRAPARAARDRRGRAHRRRSGWWAPRRSRRRSARRSLGNYIFSGLATRNDAAVLVGCAGRGRAGARRSIS